ncbi:MAG: DNA repair protein RecO [Selenomonadaceae bacterium]|nr:DNA repair protein RecO [Selenomonadaceae bacterium]
MEKFCKTEAVVLATTDFGDANRVVSFYTKEFGKIEANAYNCRRAKSPLSGAMQMFNHISLEFIRSSPVYRVHEADIINFYSISENLSKLAYASILFELVNKMSPMGQVDNSVFNLLLNALKAFDKRNPRIAAIISSCQFIQLSGFAIEYPKSMDKLFKLLMNFDWQDSTKFTLKSGELEEAEKAFYRYAQSILESPLNSLKFLHMIQSSVS